MGLGSCGLAGKREDLRRTYIKLKMQEVGQHSGGHTREGGEECLEIDLQILLPLFHQASWVFPNYLFGRKQIFINLPLCNKLQENISILTTDEEALWLRKTKASSLMPDMTSPGARGSCTRISDQTGASGLGLIKFSQYQKYQHNLRQEAPSGDI